MLCILRAQGINNLNEKRELLVKFWLLNAVDRCFQAETAQAGLEGTATSKSVSSFRHGSELGSKSHEVESLRANEMSRSGFSPTQSGTQNRLPISTFGATNTMTKLENPGPNADARSRRQFLDYQLDTLRGAQVLSKLVVLDNITNRRRGGVPCPAQAPAPFSLLVSAGVMLGHLYPVRCRCM